MTDTAKTILAAVDTSDASRAVFKDALVLASTIRANVVVVSVTPGYEGNMNRFCIKDADRQLSEPFRKILKEAADYAASLGLEMRTVHRTGKPCDEIVAVAQEERASLILLGSSKRYQVERMLLGRTMAEIIVEGPCDVLLIPEESEIRFSHILVGINGSPASMEAGRRALEIAMSYGSEVHALYVIDIPADRSLRYGVLKDAEQKAGRILNDFVGQAEKLGVPVIPEMRLNTPEKCLVDYAQENKIHLIVLGSLADSSLFDMIGGSVIERVASLTACPILVAKQPLAGAEAQSVPNFVFNS